MIAWLWRQIVIARLMLPDRVEWTGTGRQRLGRRAERRAARWLLRRGYDLVGRNLRLKAGEVDLVCWDRACRQLVLVEVKAGRHGGEYRPERHINGRKRRTLGRLSRTLAQRHGLRAARVRVDVVAVQYASGGSVKAAGNVSLRLCQTLRGLSVGVGCEKADNLIARGFNGARQSARLVEQELRHYRGLRVSARVRRVHV